MSIEYSHTLVLRDVSPGHSQLRMQVKIPRDKVSRFHIIAQVELQEI